MNHNKLPLNYLKNTRNYRSRSPNKPSDDRRIIHVPVRGVNNDDGQALYNGYGSEKPFYSDHRSRDRSPRTLSARNESREPAYSHTKSSLYQDVTGIRHNHLYGTSQSGNLMDSLTRSDTMLLPNIPQLMSTSGSRYSRESDERMTRNATSTMSIDYNNSQMSTGSLRHYMNQNDASMHNLDDYSRGAMMESILESSFRNGQNLRQDMRSRDLEVGRKLNSSSMSLGAMEARMRQSIEDQMKRSFGRDENNTSVERSLWSKQNEYDSKFPVENTNIDHRDHYVETIPQYKTRTRNESRLVRNSPLYEVSPIPANNFYEDRMHNLERQERSNKGGYNSYHETVSHKTKEHTLLSRRGLSPTLSRSSRENHENSHRKPSPFGLRKSRNHSPTRFSGRSSPTVGKRQTSRNSPTRHTRPSSPRHIRHSNNFSDRPSSPSQFLSISNSSRPSSRRSKYSPSRTSRKLSPKRSRNLHESDQFPLRAIRNSPTRYEGSKILSRIREPEKRSGRVSRRAGRHLSPTYSRRSPNRFDSRQSTNTSIMGKIRGSLSPKRLILSPRDAKWRSREIAPPFSEQNEHCSDILRYGRPPSPGIRSISPKAYSRPTLLDRGIPSPLKFCRPASPPLVSMEFGHRTSNRLGPPLTPSRRTGYFRPEDTLEKSRLEVIKSTRRNTILRLGRRMSVTSKRKRVLSSNKNGSISDKISILKSTSSRSRRRRPSPREKIAEISRISAKQRLGLKTANKLLRKATRRRRR